MRPEKPSADRLRRLVADGLTPAQIAARLGVAPSTVRQWLRAEGIAVLRPRQKALGGWDKKPPEVLRKLGEAP